MINCGEVFINKINAFPEIKDTYRGDVFEGASGITPGKRIEKLVYTNSLGQSIDFTQNGLSVNYLIDKPNWTNKPTHMYCLYMLENKDYQINEQIVDQRNFQFGDCALVINNPEVFIRRISKELNNKKYLWIADKIEYVDIDSIHNNYGLLKKPNSYSYQNEYRFLIKSEEPDPLKLHLGSLKDISLVLSFDEIRSLKIVESNN